MINDKYRYYVYIYYRLDSNEPFYVGKGTNDRWKTLSRENNHFNNIVNKHDVAVEIVKKNLTEDEAFYWEEEIINIMVFDYGYSIEIQGNRSFNERYMHLVNCTWGGDGTKGMNPYRNKTLDELNYIKCKMSKSRSGEKNHMYGKGYKVSGCKNPFYGKHHTKESKEKISNKNKYRNAKKVINIDTGEIFKSVSEATKSYNILSENQIRECCKGKRKSAKGFKWMFLDDWNNLSKYEKELKVKEKIGKQKKVINIDTNEIFESIVEASIKYNINKKSISNNCRGKSKSAGGYHWKYVTI